MVPLGTCSHIAQLNRQLDESDDEKLLTLISFPPEPPPCSNLFRAIFCSSVLVLPVNIYHQLPSIAATHHTLHSQSLQGSYLIPNQRQKRTDHHCQAYFAYYGWQLIGQALPPSRWHYTNDIANIQRCVDDSLLAQAEVVEAELLLEKCSYCSRPLEFVGLIVDDWLARARSTQR